MRSITARPNPAPALTTIVVLCLAAAMLAGCGEWKGSNTVDTEPAAEAEGKGPGLFTGKEGGIVFYNKPWTGSAPGGDVAE